MTHPEIVLDVERHEFPSEQGGLIGEDVANVLISGKPVAEVQASVEKRVNKALTKARR